MELSTGVAVFIVLRSTSSINFTQLLVTVAPDVRAGPLPYGSAVRRTEPRRGDGAGWLRISGADLRSKCAQSGEERRNGGVRGGRSRHRPVFGHRHSWGKRKSLFSRQTEAVLRSRDPLRSPWRRHGCVGAELARQRGRKALGPGGESFLKLKPNAVHGCVCFTCEGTAFPEFYFLIMSTKDFHFVMSSNGNPGAQSAACIKCLCRDSQRGAVLQKQHWNVVLFNFGVLTAAWWDSAAHLVFVRCCGWEQTPGSSSRLSWCTPLDSSITTSTRCWG